MAVGPLTPPDFLSPDSQGGSGQSSPQRAAADGNGAPVGKPPKAPKKGDRGFAVFDKNVSLIHLALT